MPYSPLPSAGGKPPERLTGGLDRVLAGLGAPPADAFTAILQHWDELVGPEAALVLVPVGVADGQLTVTTTSSAWASQARWLEAGVVARAAELVGEGVVRTLAVRVRKSG